MTGQASAIRTTNSRSGNNGGQYSANCIRRPHKPLLLVFNVISRTFKKKEKGHKVGQLKWQAPSEYQSVTYNQSRLELDKERGRDKFAYVRSSKVGWVKIRYSRPIPDIASIKEISYKKETTGEWFVSFGLETDDVDPPGTRCGFDRYEQGCRA